MISGGFSLDEGYEVLEYHPGLRDAAREYTGPEEPSLGSFTMGCYSSKLEILMEELVTQRGGRGSSIRKILIISLPGVGDSLLFTPTLAILRQAFPQAEISILVMFKASRDILELDPHADRVLYWDFLHRGKIASLRYVMGLRRQRFDLSITIYPSNRGEYNLISFLVGARLRLAHRYRHRFATSLGWLNTDTVRESDERHNVEENIHLLGLLGIMPDRWSKPNVSLSPQDAQYAQRWLKDRDLEGRHLVGFHPGTAEFKNQAQRRWPWGKFAELGDRIQKDYGAPILLFGGPEEEELKRAISEKMEYKPYLVSGTTMRQSSALIARTSVFVSNDSALMHVAAALDVPCVAIIGPTNPAWIAPYRVRHRLVRKGLDCSPCFFYSVKPLTCQRRDFACIRSIGVEEVLEQFASLWEETV